MRNFKHSVIAAIAIAMISSLAAAQADGLKDVKLQREQRINAAAATESITIARKDVTDAIKGTAELITDEGSVEETVLEGEIAAKSFYPLAYIIASGDAVNIRETPSEEAAVIDQAEIGTEVEVIESSDGWYKIVYNGGMSGYVASDYITQDAQAAEEAKMRQDNYKIAQVQLSGSAVRVRSDASTESDVLDELEDGRYVYVVEGKDDFIKVIYGSDYKEGYIINTSIEFTGEWESKDTIAEKQQEIKEAQEAARRAEEAAARQNVANAGTSSYTPQAVYNSGGSSKGQAIVNTAMQYLGVPYVWGGTSPSGFDCSGLVQYVLRQNGISVARVAADQRNCGTYVSRENLQPGDLVFFGKGSIHHVGIYVGNGNMIHAPQTGDVVKVSSINSDYRISSYAGAVRVY